MNEGYLSYTLLNQIQIGIPPSLSLSLSRFLQSQRATLRNEIRRTIFIH